MDAADVYRPHNIEELKGDPNVDQVKLAILKEPLRLNPVYDKSEPNAEPIALEAEELILVTVHHDGSTYAQFMSWYPNVFRYQAPVDSHQIQLIGEVN